MSDATVVLVALVVVGVLVSGGALLLERLVRSRLVQATRTASRRLGATVSVTLPDGSRLVQAVRGVDVLVARAEDVPVRAGASRLAELVVELDGVRRRPGRDASPPFTWRAGRFRARIAPADLLALVDPPPPVRDLRCGDGVVRAVIAPGLGVDVEVRVAGDRLVLEPRSILAALANVELVRPFPPLPAGAVLETVTVTPTGVAVTGRVPAPPR